MHANRSSFSKLLPVFALALSVAALAALTTVAYLNLRSISSHDGDVYFHSHTYQFTVPRNQFFRSSVIAAANSASRPIQSLNFPAMATEALASGIMRTWPDSWRPKIFGLLPQGLFVWRALIFPIYCLPFWWLAGLGCDAIFHRRSLHWSVLLLGSVLFSLFTFLGVGLALSGEMGGRQKDDSTFVIAGFVIWTLLMAAFPIAWARAWRRSRHSTAA